MKRGFKKLCQQYGVPTPIEYCSNGVITEEEKQQMFASSGNSFGGIQH